MFNHHATSRQIIKCNNGWLLIVPEKSHNTSGFPSIADIYKDPDVIQSLKDLQREISDDSDPIMADIRRNQKEETTHETTKKTTVFKRLA